MDAKRQPTICIALQSHHTSDTEALEFSVSQANHALTQVEYNSINYHIKQFSLKQHIQLPWQIPISTLKNLVKRILLLTNDVNENSVVIESELWPLFSLLLMIF